MPPQPPSVPNTPLAVAANLRYDDPITGIPVTQLYPNEYIEHIGGRLSYYIGRIGEIDDILGAYGERLDTAEAQIDAILASGSTSIPEVNGACFNGNQNEPVNVVTAYLVSNSCDYNTILGTTTALGQAILAQCANLNTLPAFSQNSDMAGLAGWTSSVTTFAQSFSNLWLAYCDMRAGVTQALSQSAITCASVRINAAGAYNSSERTLSLYFPGSFIPSNFSDAGSSYISVKDVDNNEFTQAISITDVISDGNITLDISASTLIQTSDYIVRVVYDLTSTTPSLGCSNTIVLNITNNTQVCPNLALWSTNTTVSFSFTPPVTTSVVYTIDIMDSSGGTALDTKTFTDPTTTVTDTFTGLTQATTYYVRVTVDNAGSTTVCSVQSIDTTS